MSDLPAGLFNPDDEGWVIGGADGREPPSLDNAISAFSLGSGMILDEDGGPATPMVRITLETDAGNHTFYISSQGLADLIHHLQVALNRLDPDNET